MKDIKTVLLGDSGVGKSSLVLRFVTDTFRPYSESTIGASFLTKILLVNEKQSKFFIWDTAGQEKYHSLAPMYYRGAQVAIIVYDITNKNSFLTLKRWIKELQLHGPPDILIAIVGNKSDLSGNRKVSYNQAKAYADEINVLFIETSAKNNSNINELFTNISNQIPEQKKNDNFSNIVDINKIDNNKNFYYCC